MTQARRIGFPISQIEFLLLCNLSHRASHGYAIAKDIQQATKGQVRISAATLYDNLSHLLSDSLIELAGEQVKQSRLRKLYKITPAGIVARDKYRLLLRQGCKPF